MSLFRVAVAAIVLVALAAGATASRAARKDEPDKVVVQHILIGFKRTVPDSANTPTFPRKEKPVPRQEATVSPSFKKNRRFRASCTKI